MMAQQYRKGRIVHLTGITIFAMALLTAMTGLFGTGPLSKVKEQTADAALKAEFGRFIRYQAPTELKFQIATHMVSNGVVNLKISKTFVNHVEIERIDPEPETQTAGTDLVIYDFRAEPTATAEIRIRFAASHFGPLHYQVSAGNGQILHLRHFAYP